jgi:hypothetical protein
MDMKWVMQRAATGDKGSRDGAVLVVVALLLVVLFGLMGLVFDAGLLMSAQRQVQNAADAAALAAAEDRMRGQSVATAIATGIEFVTVHNQLSDATVTINIPPLQGPYAGNANYAEAIVGSPSTTFFMQILGNDPRQWTRGRAVAGFEAVSAGEGVAVLDPDARPGLSVSGGGTIRVLGRVVVNSEGGGVDEFGQPINNGNSGVAASGANQPNPETGLFAADISVVGGVDKPGNFKNIDPALPSPLRTRQLPEPDPLLNLPVPTVANGVNNLDFGTVSVTNNNSNPGKSPNFYDPSTGVTTLHPGLYTSIDVQGGKVVFTPGIYVIKWKSSGGGTALRITGGEVTAEGIMLYNTGHNYKATDGTPDNNDGARRPPASGNLEDGANFGGFTINAGMRFTPIDTTQFTYNPPVSPEFNGMLFYQRRRIRNSLSMQGNSQAGVLLGTLYAKWAEFRIAGQGTYDAQFLAGSMAVTGQGDVTINHAGKNLGKANRVFLVE